MWGKFPAFLVERERMMKFGARANWSSARRGKGFSAEEKRKWANAGKRERAAIASEIPAGLAVPFARACWEALADAGDNTQRRRDSTLSSERGVMPRHASSAVRSAKKENET